MPTEEFLWVWSQRAALTLARYLILAGGAYALVWRVFGARLRARRIARASPHEARREQLRREWRYGASTILIFSLVSALSHWLTLAGATRVYFSVAEYGWPYFIVSVGLAVLFHDTYFYAAHRFAHSRWFFRFHALHHRSVAPTPFSVYSFHPLDAVLNIAFVPPMLMLIPLHPGALFLFLIYTMIFNVVGHLGHELYPGVFAPGRALGWNNTATHHHMHHENMGSHYSFYFNWLDRLFGTMHPDYASRFLAHAAPPGRGAGEREGGAW